MDTKSRKTDDLDFQQHSQTVPNNEWTVLRDSTPETMFQALQTFAANRFRWKRTSSHSFSEEDTNKSFGFNNRMIRRCNVQCISSSTCTFELNTKFDLSLAKYIFQIKNLEH
eukprot:snap_masked-scaffold_9-processed-gene-1.17-mRNA-1 protein AED:1.00 eAED:1.00 QI:0/-1/0/0/-1/1/1/0/111